jgi:hypothetical protein
MVGIVTASLLLASPDAALKLLTPDEAFEAPPVPPPVVAPPEAAFDAPPAPRWPGITALWLGGGVLTVSTIYGGYTMFDTSRCIDFCSGGPNSAADELQNTGLMVGAGVLTMLAGMGYLAWVQPDEEPRPKSPGYVALSTGITQLLGGVFRYLMVSDAEPFGSWERRSAGIVIGAGAVALAAGIVWLAWAAH